MSIHYPSVVEKSPAFSKCRAFNSVNFYLPLALVNDRMMTIVAVVIWRIAEAVPRRPTDKARRFA